MDDNVIIDLYWARSESAIDETSKKYGGYCHKIAWNILQNKQDCEECVNDTFLKAWNAIPPERPIIFSSFLGKITRNLSLNKYKRQKAQKRGGDEIELLLGELEDCAPSRGSVEAEYESGVTAKAISNFLYSVSEENRLVFTRRYWYADSIASIAERFNMSESKVKSMLMRTRNKLKDYLEREGVTI